MDLNDGAVRDLVPELRRKAREKYLKDREGQQLHLYKKILDDQKKMFKAEEAQDRMMEEIM